MKNMFCQLAATFHSIAFRPEHETTMIRMVELYHLACLGFHPSHQNDRPQMEITREAKEKKHGLRLRPSRARSARWLFSLLSLVLFIFGLAIRMTTQDVTVWHFRAPK